MRIQSGHNATVSATRDSPRKSKTAKRRFGDGENAQNRSSVAILFGIKAGWANPPYHPDSAARRPYL